MTSSSISESLFNRHVFYACYTGAEPADHLHGRLSRLRKDFFTTGGKRVSARGRIDESGYEGKVRGSLSKHSIHWKKTVGGVATEEAFLVNKNFVVVLRDLNGRIYGKVYYDRSLLWLKTEYFSANDFISADLIFKPVETMDAVEKFTYDAQTRNYSSVLLYPVPYRHGTPEQSLLNSRHGEELLLVSADHGEFCYCEKEEAEERRKSAQELDSGTIMLLPAWEVRDGEITEPEEFPAQDPPLLPEEETPAPAAKAELPAAPAAEEPLEADQPATEDPTSSVSVSRESVSPAKVDESAGTIEKYDLTLTVERTKKAPPVKTTIVSGGENYNYTGTLIGGKRQGRGRTDLKSGMTAFDGEYVDNKREGFGCSYYKSGNLSYAGSWKQDKKDGLGVSFRNKDHAIQVCRWSDGKPEGFTTLFDAEGNLRYSGAIVEGKKQGVGVSFRREDGSVFVGKWDGGEEANSGSLFDSQGNLIYSGGWKDGQRNGTGTEFDAAGQIVYSGEWKDDKYLNGILYQKI